MFVEQRGLCAACGHEHKLFVDHCHSSKQVRALLCHHCNTGIGLARENITILERWIMYLRKHKVVQVPNDGTA